VVAVDTPHHVTQRGNARRAIFETDGDRLVYLSLLLEFSQLHHVRILGYCLMPNHVHLIAVPQQFDSLARSLRFTHGRYASYLNARQQATGHVWQGRYYSCPMDQDHLWTALRYTERNPVRAGLVDDPEAYPWSSARAHCQGFPDGLTELDMWRARWTAHEWREFVTCRNAAEEAEAALIRLNTHSGRPLGEPDFVVRLERRLGRCLTTRKGGRPPRTGESITRQFTFTLS